MNAETFPNRRKEGTGRAEELRVGQLMMEMNQRLMQEPEKNKDALEELATLQAEFITKARARKLDSIEAKKMEDAARKLERKSARPRPLPSAPVVPIPVHETPAMNRRELRARVRQFPNVAPPKLAYETQPVEPSRNFDELKGFEGGRTPVPEKGYASIPETDKDGAPRAALSPRERAIQNARRIKAAAEKAKPFENISVPISQETKIGAEWLPETKVSLTIPSQPKRIGPTQAPEAVPQAKAEASAEVSEPAVPVQAAASEEPKHVFVNRVEEPAAPKTEEAAAEAPQPSTPEIDPHDAWDKAQFEAYEAKRTRGEIDDPHDAWDVSKFNEHAQKNAAKEDAVDPEYEKHLMWARGLQKSRRSPGVLAHLPGIDGKTPERRLGTPETSAPKIEEKRQQAPASPEKVAELTHARDEVRNEYLEALRYSSSAGVPLPHGIAEKIGDIISSTLPGREPKKALKLEDARRRFEAARADLNAAMDAEQPLARFNETIRIDRSAMLDVRAAALGERGHDTYEKILESFSRAKGWAGEKIKNKSKLRSMKAAAISALFVGGVSLLALFQDAGPSHDTRAKRETAIARPNTPLKSGKVENYLKAPEKVYAEKDTDYPHLLGQLQHKLKSQYPTAAALRAAPQEVKDFLAGDVNRIAHDIASRPDIKLYDPVHHTSVTIPKGAGLSLAPGGHLMFNDGHGNMQYHGTMRALVHGTLNQHVRSNETAMDNTKYLNQHHAQFDTSEQVNASARQYAEWKEKHKEWEAQNEQYQRELTAWKEAQERHAALPSQRASGIGAFLGRIFGHPTHRVPDVDIAPPGTPPHMITRAQRKNEETLYQRIDHSHAAHAVNAPEMSSAAADSQASPETPVPHSGTEAYVNRFGVPVDPKFPYIYQLADGTTFVSGGKDMNAVVKLAQKHAFDFKVPVYVHEAFASKHTPTGTIDAVVEFAYRADGTLVMHAVPGMAVPNPEEAVRIVK